MRVCRFTLSSGGGEAYACLDGVAGQARLVEDGAALPETLAADEVCAVIYNDADLGEQQRVQDWQAQAGDAVQLTARLRGALITWRTTGRGARVLIHGPDDLAEETLEAVAQFALLDRALCDLRAEAGALAQNLALVQDTAELERCVEDVRGAFNRATASRLSALRLLAYFETPARTAPAGPALRLRTELTVQALMADALTHLLQEFDVLQTTFEAELQHTQEQRRARLEKRIGLTIIAILLVEGALILYDALIYDIIFNTFPK